MNGETGLVTRLIRYLPGIYQEPDPQVAEPAATSPKFQRPCLDEYLEAFEELLLGLQREEGPESKAGHPEAGRSKEDRSSGLERMVARLHRYFDPRTVPAPFLPWLAQWVALTLLPGVPVETNRKLLARMVPLYRCRGTRRCLEELLAIVLPVPAEIRDDFPPFQIGRHSTVGRNSWVGGGPSHFFHVTLTFSRTTGPEVQRQRRIAEYVIEMAKPAHTDYQLDVATPRFQVGVYSTVAVDSFL